FNAQLDDFRTIYEVDKIETEKKSLRNYLLFALGGCFLLMILLGIWVYYSRLIMNKNRVMVKTIHELQEEQTRRTDEILRKTSFEPIEDAKDKLHPKTQKNELCVAIRDLIFKEKIYLDPELTRDSLINHLATNKPLFAEAFVLCFGTVSFTEYINSLRLKDAITLLEQTDLPMETLSERAGVGTVRTFQRRVKSKYDMSPYDYRKLVAA
ncbi:MAG: helix-turn-helix domain-containing protein, partial [Candidatus Symbiothrix sp.]|nr:helix-turn-helix domain-containing protein [Candidatus Symbiothrix sp.]